MNNRSATEARVNRQRTPLLFFCLPMEFIPDLSYDHYLFVILHSYILTEMMSSFSEMAFSNFELC